MCDGCAHQSTCKALGMSESKEPRKEACFEPVAAGMNLFKMAELSRGVPAAHYLIKGQQLARI